MQMSSSTLLLVLLGTKETGGALVRSGEDVCARCTLVYMSPYLHRVSKRSEFSPSKTKPICSCAVVRLRRLMSSVLAVGCSQDLIEVRQLPNAVSKRPNDERSQ